MPKYMGKLNQLRTMNEFVVAKKGGSNIKELGALEHLTGSLTMSNMKYIKDAADMREANLKEKQLHTLKLLWQRQMEYYYDCSQYNYSREEAQHQEQLLEALELNHNVKHLAVEGYGSNKFPKLLADVSHFLPSLVSLVLCGCPNIESLPHLSKLPSLQKLEIRKFEGIKVIGEEFYGNGSFPRLSSLMFSEMGELEGWDICYEGESFPRLEQLRIDGCPRLKKSLPQHLPCLKTLDIVGCGNLEATLPKSSCMEELSLSFCQKIRVKDMPTWSTSDVLPPLHDLKLASCRAMESLPQGGMLSNLQRLTIRCCSSKLIESGRDWGLHELLSLKELDICGIQDIECFPEEGLLPPSLRSLSISNCLYMKRINHGGLVHLHSLTSLSFSFCPSMSFEGMAEDGLPPSLSHLTIYDCQLLKERCGKEKGPDWPIIAHIPHIHIYGPQQG